MGANASQQKLAKSANLAPPPYNDSPPSSAPPPPLLNKKSANLARPSSPPPPPYNDSPPRRSPPLLNNNQPSASLLNNTNKLGASSPSPSPSSSNKNRTPRNNQTSRSNQTPRNNQTSTNNSKSQPDYRTYGAAKYGPGRDKWGKLVDYGRPLTKDDDINNGLFIMDPNSYKRSKIIRYKASEYPGYGVPEELELTDDMLKNRDKYEKIEKEYEKIRTEVTKLYRNMIDYSEIAEEAYRTLYHDFLLPTHGDPKANELYHLFRQFKKGKYGFVLMETAPFINLKTLEYRPFNPELPRNKHVHKDIALVDVLIEFMNMQELPTRITLAQKLADLTKIQQITFKYTTSKNIHNAEQIFHGFDIITYIQNNRKSELLDNFLQAMFSVKTEYDIGKKDEDKLKYIGFDLKSLNRGNKNSYDGKKLKYQGMINCCINNNDPEICKHKESGFFSFGLRKKDPKLCPYPANSNSPRSNPVPRTIFPGGRRRTRHKRTRRTRRTRR